MELNRKRIISELEGLAEFLTCPEYIKDALVLIKELTEENERLREDNEIKSQKRANIFEIANAFERGRTDGVRKMQERLTMRFGTYTEKDMTPISELFILIDQIAKEMLEGE